MTTITTLDGRRLDVGVAGAADGVPLVFHHGTPGSVRPFRHIEQIAHERGLRLVTFSRAVNPGRARESGQARDTGR